MDKYRGYVTVDGISLSELTEFADSWEWFASFECHQEISGGKFNIWMSPTQWPKVRWSEAAMCFSYKLSNRWEKYASRIKVRAYKAAKNLEKSKYYYGVI